jgi:two-component system chemotaxis response regulator CheB
MNPLTRKIRVLVVDDSAIVRKVLADAIRGEPDMEVVAVASIRSWRATSSCSTIPTSSPSTSRCRMDGLTFLRKLMEATYPVIIVSSLTRGSAASRRPAHRRDRRDPEARRAYSVGQVTEKLKQRIRLLRTPGFKLQARTASASPSTTPGPTVAADAAASRAKGLIAIGASTGGTQAIEALLTRLPADVPPIVITQHMPANFTRAFAERLNGLCPMRVVEAKGNEVLQRSTAYIAPGDYHMVLERFGVEIRTSLKQGPPVHHQRPAVDVMFASIARLQGLSVVALLLTGMGADGADGMVALRRAGAETIAEDEHSCVVFGMPKEAIARGGAVHVATLLRMPNLIFESFDRLRSRRVA